ncbi:hypothetical protein IMAU20009_00165 [Lactiplantibacillus plantarum]|nr:hypothetical protein [Lactiplantibacillus plantarum]MCG0672466.1 hypothetical protein [Lactiplantibacillus plantarum]MCG0780690.1 hypothetical protein [Lactiplantibacillus plantarum]MCG0808368.1 hypothetical protein [Lactiplantibacillus plantarum]MCG0860926.1 hypothetical protein [Lactiplantibacillus plantarum]
MTGFSGLPLPISTPYLRVLIYTLTLHNASMVPSSLTILTTAVHMPATNVFAHHRHKKISRAPHSRDFFASSHAFFQAKALALAAISAKLINVRPY